ncbi:hypothetical protein N0Z92_23980, partial [Pseudomonas aeruginosa]|nr:hypothetical protein [Pseudomonas aeruginosa]
MSECLFLKAILFLLTAYLFGLWELHRPEYPTCWMSPERLACWSLAAVAGLAGARANGSSRSEQAPRRGR